MFALACAWWAFDLGVLRAGVPAPLDDVWEYALVARHLLAGDGFRTTALHPPLWELRDAAFSVPVLVHGPLLPLMLMPFVALARETTVAAIAWIAAAFAALTAVVIHRAASRIADTRDAAAAALLFTLSPFTMNAIHHDAAFAIGAFWLTLALERMAARRFFIAGLAAGAGALVRPEFVIVALALAAFAPGGRRRLGAGFLLPWLPWAWHQSVSSGAPLFNVSSYLLLAYTTTYPELSALRAFDLAPARWTGTLITSFHALLAKWTYAAPRALAHLATSPSIATGGLSAIGLATMLRRPIPAAPALGALTAVLLVIPLALLIVAERRPGLLVPFLPLWSFAAVVGVRALLANLRVRAAWAPFALLALLALPPALAAARDGVREARANEAWLARERAALVKRFGVANSHGRGRPTMPTLVFSDTPDLVAWDTGRPTLWVTRAEWERLYDDAATGVAPLPRDLPLTRDAATTWFHEDPRTLREAGARR